MVGNEDMLGDWFSWVTRGLPRVNGELRTLDTILIIGFAVVTTALAVVVVVMARFLAPCGGDLRLAQHLLLLQEHALLALLAELGQAARELHETPV